MRLSRRGMLSVLGGASVVATGDAVAASKTPPLGVPTAWQYTYDPPRWDHGWDVAATDDALYVAGALGESPEKLIRVVRTTRPSNGRPEPTGDFFFEDRFQMRGEIEGFVRRPDGDFDLAISDGELARVAPTGDLRHVVDPGDWPFFPGGVVPRPDGSSLALGAGPERDVPAAAVVTAGGTVSTVRQFPVPGDRGWIDSAVPRSDGGAVGLGTTALGEEESELRFYHVGPGGDLVASRRLDAPAGVWGGTRIAGGAAFAGGATADDDGDGGYVVAVDDAGRLRWQRRLAEHTGVRDVAGLPDGGVIAAGIRLPVESEQRSGRRGAVATAWVAKLTRDGELAWQGPLAAGGGPPLWAVTVADGTVFVAGTVWPSPGDDDESGIFVAEVGEPVTLGPAETTALGLAGVGALAGGAVAFERRFGE